MRNASKPIFIMLLFPLLFLGCQDNQESDTQPLDPATAIIGTWKVDIEATKLGWADKKEELTRMMVDELQKGFEFRDDNSITLTREGSTQKGEGVWSVKSKTEDTIVLELAPKESRPGTKKVDWTIKILDKDRISYFSSEVVEGVMIMTREK